MKPEPRRKPAKPERIAAELAILLSESELNDPIWLLNKQMRHFDYEVITQEANTDA